MIRDRTVSLYAGPGPRGRLGRVRKILTIFFDCVKTGGVVVPVEAILRLSSIPSALWGGHLCTLGRALLGEFRTVGRRNRTADYEQNMYIVCLVSIQLTFFLNCASLCIQELSGIPSGGSAGSMVGAVVLALACQSFMARNPRPGCSNRRLLAALTDVHAGSAVHDQAMLAAVAQLRVCPIDASRIFHGRGGSYPGCAHLTLDYFHPVWLLTSFVELRDADLSRYHEALSDCWDRIAPPGNGSLTWVYQYRAPTSALLDTPGRAETRLMAGEVPEPHIVTEDGQKFRVFTQPRGRNHGLVLDMACARSWVKYHAKGQTVLNLFAYTCAFSVAALSGGAAKVVNLDMNKGALATGRQNHELNGLVSGAWFLGHNVFKSWAKIKRFGPYGMVLVDPPSYQKGSFVAKDDYAKLLRRIPSLLCSGGYALLCLNAPELDTGFLQSQVEGAAPELQFVERLANPASFPTVWPQKSLKVLVYRLPGPPGDESAEFERGRGPTRPLRVGVAPSL